MISNIAKKFNILAILYWFVAIISDDVAKKKG